VTTLDVMLFNYEKGGKRPDGSYDLEPLARTVGLRTPHVLILNEAAGYAYRCSRTLYKAAAALTKHTGAVFIPLIGWTDRGDYPPAIFYQPEHIQIDGHAGTHPDDPAHMVNLVEANLRECGTPIRFLPIHFDPQSGLKRLLEAEQISWTADPNHLTVVAGDFNSVSTNPHDDMPSFEDHPLHQRFHKGLWKPDIVPHDGLPDGPDTRALDRLLAGGLTDVADVAFAQGMPSAQAYTPTVNDGIDPHGPLRIDRILVSAPLAARIARDSYRVWVPDGQTRSDYPSDHRAVSVTFTI
jgi:endonuclease/exonuclease/phosphatase family metal-dependent hydrolase